MSWTKREAVSNLVVLGDDEGHVKKVGGLLIGTPRDRVYPDKTNYVLVKQSGEEFVLSGSASLNRQLSESDIGKFVKCEFLGWGKSANGKFKEIDVVVWDGEPTDDMKKWPRYGEFAKGKGKTSAKDENGDAVDDDDADDDDLPF